jgi:protein-S-isoprenylcysteine O-methyltransferase Ste14
MPAETNQTEEPTGELLREALDETRELVRLEVALAREEVRGELARAKKGGISLGAAVVLSLCALAMFLVAVASAFTPMWLAAVVIGGILLLVGALLGYLGYRAIPQRPMWETKERLESDVKQLRERIA